MKLEDLTVANLKALIKTYNLHLVIKNYSKMKREELITAIKKHMTVLTGSVEVAKKTIPVNEPVVKVKKVKAEKKPRETKIKEAKVKPDKPENNEKQEKIFDKLKRIYDGAVSWYNKGHKEKPILRDDQYAFIWDLYKANHHPSSLEPFLNYVYIFNSKKTENIKITNLTGVFNLAYYPFDKITGRSTNYPENKMIDVQKGYGIK